MPEAKELESLLVQAFMRGGLYALGRPLAAERGGVHAVRVAREILDAARTEAPAPQGERSSYPPAAYLKEWTFRGDNYEEPRRRVDLDARRESWMPDDTKVTPLFAITAPQGDVEGKGSLPELPCADAGPCSPSSPDTQRLLNEIWRAVDVLGAPQTACATDEERAYCRAIADACAAIEAFGGQYDRSIP